MRSLPLCQQASSALSSWCTWDFAQATGQQLEVPAPLVGFVDQIARSTIRLDNRGEGKGFAPETTVKGDEPLERLIAFSGRTI